MCFERAGNHWHVFFRTAPVPYIFPRRFVFADSCKIRDLFLRYGASKLSEDMAAFDYAVGRGKGIVDLFLGDEQFAVLKAERAQPGRAGLDATRRKLG